MSSGSRRSRQPLAAAMTSGKTASSSPEAQTSAPSRI
jgi:hypothetical protein